MLGCGTKRSMPDEQPLRVRTQIVEFVAHPRRASLTGEFRARIQSDLSFRIGGRIASRNVDVGDRVQPGDILASIDTLQQMADVTAAKAALRSAEATLQQLSADMQRIETLLPSQAASQSEYDDAKAAFLTAQGLVQISGSVLAAAEVQLAYTDIIATTPGLVISRNAEVGQVVSPTQTVFTVADDGEREAVFDVFQTHIADPPIDNKIALTLISDPTVKATGIIREIAPSIDESSGTVRVKVTVPNPPPQMTLGAPVIGEAQFQSIEVVELPWTVLMREGDQAAVWIVDPQLHTVSERTVQVQSYASGMLLVSSGVAAGEIVVSEGAQLLRPGQRVDPLAAPPRAHSQTTGTKQ
jgi:RND family efflux transporter MFP subunit